MPSQADWSPVAEELDRWRAAGRVASIWLRDDDAIEPTPALERLLALLRSCTAPCLVAAIPMLAGAALAARLSGEPLVTVAVHGAWHRNHAPPGRKSEETPPERGLDTIRDELRQSRARLTELFGPAAGRWYVPPWNRIGPAVAATLPDLGFTRLSAFAAHAGGAALVQLNTHVDLIDWRNGRRGRTESEIAGALGEALAGARAAQFRPVGVLAHHLAHDEQAWRSLTALLDVVRAHPAAALAHPDALADAVAGC